MEPVLLTDPGTGSTARIAPQIGFNCYAFQAMVDGQAVDIIAADADFPAGHKPPNRHGIPILFPFPNRIQDGTFTWQDRTFELPGGELCTDPNGHPLHGFCLDQPWRVVDQGPHFAVGEFQLSRDAPHRLRLWPADFRLRVAYELNGPSLRTEVEITNSDEQPLPWGFGTHPYFRLPLASGSETGDCLIEAPATEQWELRDGLPTGKRIPVGPEKDLRDGAYFDQLELDDVLTGLSPGPAGSVKATIYDEAAGLQVVERFDARFRELVVFTPSWHNAICLEPYTCTTNAVNLSRQGIDSGWQVLEPGERFRTWIEIFAGPVLV